MRNVRGSAMLGDVTVLMLKMKATQALYKVRLICISNSWVTYRHGVLHPHVLQIYKTVKKKNLFQQDNANIPAIWHELFVVLSYHIP